MLSGARCGTTKIGWEMIFLAVEKLGLKARLEGKPEQCK